MHLMARKTTPCGDRTTPAPISKSAVTMGITNHVRNVMLNSLGMKKAIQEIDSCFFLEYPLEIPEYWY
ncbi:hypothetical protein TNCV_4121261 [Trichonephila clavipes]|nr:hypothetical protein TNCV_4121261 [Trichonephila clavipes]